MTTEFDDFDIDLPEQAQSAKGSAKYQGEWQRIYIEPNPITGERYNVGVALHINGQTYTRLIDTTDRLKCLFSKPALHNIQFAIKHIQDVYKTKDSVPDIFGLSAPLPASGTDINTLLADLYDDVVPLGRPFRALQDDTFKAKITKGQLITDVYDYLKQKHQLQANQIIPQNQSLTIDDDGHTVDVPLLSQSRIADLISATYARAFDVERIINQSVVDLSAVRSYKKRFDQAGLFLLKPTLDLGFTKQETTQAEQAIDNLLWKLKRDFYLSVEDTPLALAESAAHWFDIQSA
ncbi:hypothetical protein [Thiomicrorhabdus sp.]|uniref:hypothetical protein n=1 Tax=Thiomicrorhabdus sp. TaxID=2039724 RepID=UPI0029C82E2F|nr:hypothetical protein [Thiomicrorhabdus sp.]